MTESTDRLAAAAKVANEKLFDRMQEHFSAGGVFYDGTDRAYEKCRDALVAYEAEAEIREKERVVLSAVAKWQQGATPNGVPDLAAAYFALLAARKEKP